MSVRAKFKVTRVERSMGSREVPASEPGGRPTWEPTEIQTIILNPVYSPDPASENHQFWQASPSGEIRLGTINPAAWEAFALDQEYYVTFTPVEKPA